MYWNQWLWHSSVKEPHRGAKWIDAHGAVCPPVYIIHIHRMTSEASFHGDRSEGNILLSVLIYCKALLFFRKHFPWQSGQVCFWWGRQDLKIQLVQKLTTILPYWITCRRVACCSKWMVCVFACVCVCVSVSVCLCVVCLCAHSCLQLWNVVWSPSSGSMVVLH